MQDGKVAAVEVLNRPRPRHRHAGHQRAAGQVRRCATAEEIDAVDSVSSATITSNALKEAVKAALAQAK
ncbi:MAG: FMN-binding protein [Christensenellales bacterium]